MMRSNYRIPAGIIAVLCVLLLTGLALPVAGGGDSSHIITIIKAGPDGTVLENRTVDLAWMKENLPQAGDGRTHYYHQGPAAFGWDSVHPGEPLDMWDPEETVNYRTKDMGAVKGTDINDLCELVGGLESGDEVEISAVPYGEHGFSKKFSSENIRNPDPRQGPAVIDWASWRLVFLADTSSNPDGLHVFGIYDMHECLQEKYWHYYNGEYPASTGLSVKDVRTIIIHSGGSADDRGGHSSESDGNDKQVPETGSLNITSTPANATVIIDGEFTEYLTNATIPDVPFGDYAITVYREGYHRPAEIWITVQSTGTISQNFEPEKCLGTITASSVPEGAYIWIDGANTTQRTDGSPSEIMAGRHTISLHLSGYLPQSEEVLVQEDRDSPVEMVLTPACRNEKPETLSLVESGSVEGDVRYICYSEYTGLIPGRKSLSFSLPVETEGMVRTARLSVYTDCGQDIMTRQWSEPQACVSLGSLLMPAAVWQAKGTHGMGSSTQSYDLSDSLNGTDTYCLGVENTGDGGHVFSVAGIGLLMVTEAPACPERDYLLYEGCSGQNCHINLCITPEMAAGTGSAELLIASTGEGNLSAELNGNALTGVQASGPPLRIIRYQADKFLSEGDNSLSLSGSQIRTVLLTIKHDQQNTEAEEQETGFIDWILSLFGILSGQEEQNPGTADDILTEGEISSGNLEAAERLTPETDMPGSQAVHTGGLYVVSVPSHAAIYLDGKLTDFRSPHLIYGLKEGLHTVRLRIGEEEMRYAEQKIWITPDTISQADFDLNLDDHTVDINLESSGYAGENFTLNGVYPTHTFPDSLSTETFGSYITIHRDGYYDSISLGALEKGSTIWIEPEQRHHGSLAVRSEPEGSAITIDSYETGLLTPATAEGISEGPHLITVSKAGYIPSRRMIKMVDTPRDVDMSLDLSPEPYAWGSLNLTSTPEGADIYLYKRFSGRKTPCTFEYMPIGTYNVGLSYNGSATEMLDVTVLPMQEGHGHRTF